MIKSLYFHHKLFIILLIKNFKNTLNLRANKNKLQVKV